MLLRFGRKGKEDVKTIKDVEERIVELEKMTREVLAAHNQTVVKLGEIHEWMRELKRDGCGK